jgi:LysR family hydrogen peroxide-inducible transcriptional activator
MSALNLNQISLTQLTYIVAVEESKNFGLAAKKCRVTQPTLSMQIQKCEKHLGVSIFDRSKQPIVPTLIGKKIIDQARVILKDAKTLQDIVNQDQKLIEGEFKLAIIPSLASYLLPLFIGQFVKAHPKVHLVIEELLTDQIIAQLRTDQIDAGILATPLYEDGIQESTLFYEPFYVYASDGHPLRKMNQVTSEDLNHSDLWLLKEGHCFRGQVAQICKKRKNSKMPASSIEFESVSLNMLKVLVDQGLGYTLLPELAIRQISDNKEKARVLAFKKPFPVREISLVKSRIFSKKLIFDALFNEIRKKMPQDLLQNKQFKRIGIET